MSLNRGLLYRNIKLIKDANFVTGLSVRLIKGVHLIGGPLNRGFTVISSIKVTTCMSMGFCSFFFVKTVIKL